MMGMLKGSVPRRGVRARSLLLWHSPSGVFIAPWFVGSSASLAAQDLQGPSVLFGRDLAAGKALPQDLLRRVPGRFSAIGGTVPGEEAGQNPGYEEQYSAPEQQRKQYPRPPRTVPALSSPVVLIPVRTTLYQQGDEHPRFHENVH